MERTAVRTGRSPRQHQWDAGMDQSSSAATGQQGQRAVSITKCGPDPTSRLQSQTSSSEANDERVLIRGGASTDIFLTLYTSWRSPLSTS